MSDRTLPSTRRPRKSTGYSPLRKRMEKENITVDVASSLAGNGIRKKSRSKSIGPGGLDVLKSGSGNRRVSLAAPVRPPPRSILKPTIPLIPEIPPHKPKSRNGNNASHGQGIDLLGLFNGEPSSSGTKVALRTEEEQQAAAREREDEERKALEKEIKDRREARRKSLANRRVSFAAEATLHTFHEVEFNQDNIGSTDATRRASQSTAQPPPPDEMSDPPSTPPEQVEDVPDTPEHQRELHQKKHRRSSALPSADYDDDNTVASTVYSSDSDATDGVLEVEEEVGSDDGSDSDADGTTMDLVVDEVTGTSIASELSARSLSPDDLNDTLDDALRLAARQAQTQSIDEEEEIIPSFGWARKPVPKQDSPAKLASNASRQSPRANEPEDQGGDEEGMTMDMDVTQVMGGIFKPNQGTEGLEPDEEMSMDVTKVLGGIMPQRSASMRNSMSPEKTHEDSRMDDSTMDLTMSIGQIRQAPQEDAGDVESNADEHEDMSMELTRIMGGVMPSKQAAGNKRESLPNLRRTLARADDDFPMDMTIGLGRIIPADQINEDEGEGDAEAMDMTMAIGGIIKGPSPVKDRTVAKRVMEEEADQADSSPLLPGSPLKRQVSTVVGASAVSETGSPGPQAYNDVSLERSVVAGTYTVPMLELHQHPCRELKYSSEGRRIVPEIEMETLKENSPLFKENITPTPEPKLLMDHGGERMHLQDFLNMTSIRFMELTTTKRRHTQAPAALKDSTLHLGDDDVSLERCVVAGACTVPMLELYQHSCRELKKYISEGRRIVREIEEETLEENPPLFKEYITATPEFKLLMDNQFKNVKTHARLLSKAMWYEWRMKLQDGLKEGLLKIAEDMVEDEQFLQKQEALLQTVLPNLAKQLETLEGEHESLQCAAQEIADCDPEELQAARTELSEVDSENAEKMRMIEELRHVLQETEATVNDMTERKQECISAIEEAEKVREECRGWTSAEIRALKSNVDAIERDYGWAVKRLSGTTVCMTYRRQIELSFDIAFFQGANSSAAIDLCCIAAKQEADSQPPAPEKAFFCACIRDYVRSLAPSEIKIPTLLRLVSSAWNRAIAVSNNIRLLNCTFPTELVAASESSLILKVALLLVPLETKVHIAVDIQARSSANGLDFGIVPQAHVAYGEQFKMDKVNEYLSTRMGAQISTQEENGAVESWSDIIVELHERLIARGRR